MSETTPNKGYASALKALTRYADQMLALPQAMRGQMLRGSGSVAEFEMLLAERCGFPYCLATCNATAALLTGLIAADLSGKSVAVMEDAWVGSLGALRLANVTVVPFFQCNSADTDCKAVLAVDSETERHRAQELRRRCDKNGWLYIEDTGWLPGITAPSDAPSLADIQVLSFGPGKPLCLGEGGALLCRDASLYQRAVTLSQHPERVHYEFGETSGVPLLNSRVHPLAAILGVGYLKSLSGRAFE